MPNSIIVAITAVSVLIASRGFLLLLSMASGTGAILQTLIAVAIAILILVGIIKGHRLAWQWGRILGIIGAILMTVITIGLFLSEAAWIEKVFARTFMVIDTISLYVIFFAIGTKEAKKYFRLICPQCGMETSKAGDFLFTKALCKKCNIKW